MRKPAKRKPSDLKHPNSSTERAWNGDQRPVKNPDRWNGNSDLDDTGSFTRRADKGLRTVEGSRPPSRTVIKNGQLVNAPVADLDKSSRVKGPLKPIPADHQFEVSMRADLKPLRDNGPTVHHIGPSYTAGRGPSKQQRAEDDRKAIEAQQKPLTVAQKRMLKGK